MNKKILETKIAELLSVSENEKNLAFSIFKEKLSGFLNVGEALRISDLGVFQLKEKLDHNDDSKSGKLTLVYSPVSDEQSSESLFINLELDKQISDDSAFNEDVFQLGIGKPLITNVADNNDKADQAKSITEKIEENVTSILENSEKLEGYDLWEDYLERKETKSILDEPEDTDLTIDSIMEESEGEIQDIDLDVLDDDFIPKEEEDLLDEYMQDTNFLNEDVPDENEDHLKIDDIQIPDSFDDSLDSETSTDKLNENNSKIEIPDFDSDKADLKEEELDDSSVIEKIEEEIEELDVLENLSIEEPIYEDELSEPFDKEPDSLPKDNNEEMIDEISDEAVIDDIESIVSAESNFDDEIDKAAELSNFDDNIEEAQEQIGIDSTIENEEVEEPVENTDDEDIVYATENLTETSHIEKRTKRKLLIPLLITAFILIAAVGIYYIFFNNSSIAEKEPMNEITIAEDNIDESDSPVILDENPQINNVDEAADIIDDEEIPNVSTSPIVSEEMPEVASTEETEVSENIYYDGFVYNVQVSSWRQESIAENEVNKLVKKGFPAYKVEVYIPQFKGTWYRVRVGPFPSLVEAQESKQKVNK